MLPMLGLAAYTFVFFADVKSELRSREVDLITKEFRMSFAVLNAQQSFMALESILNEVVPKKYLEKVAKKMTEIGA